MSVLSQVDLSLALSEKEYAHQLVRHQVALAQLGYQVYVEKRPVVMVFEGWDAAGKGGAIKRLTERLDPRGYVVYPIAAPAGEDKTHHYLYRFWRRLPERGQIAIFDRSWYGRVLVERIEGFCSEEEWRRAYREINQFERELVDFGTIVFKFWMHVGKDEQVARFEQRQQTPYKAWKLTDEDWRNREKWDAYEAAVEEMILKTSTLTAPWTIIEGNDKWWGRVKVLRTVVEGLSKELVHTPASLATTSAPGGKKKGKKKRAAAGEPEAETKGKAKPEAKPLPDVKPKAAPGPKAKAKADLAVKARPGTKSKAAPGAEVKADLAVETGRGTKSKADSGAKAGPEPKPKPKGK